MILAHHIILTGYGHWLPNDPRGSLSRELRSEQLGDLGDIHYGRRHVQPPRSELQQFHRKAKEFLKHPVIWFDPPLRQMIGEAFGQLMRREKLTCYSCAVLNNHAHLLIRRHRLKAEEMIRLLWDCSRQAVAERIPTRHPLWSKDPFVAFKDSPKAIETTVNYIYSNFAKHHIEPQTWDFTVRHERWYGSVKSDQEQRRTPNSKL